MNTGGLLFFAIRAVGLSESSVEARQNIIEWYLPSKIKESLGSVDSLGGPTVMLIAKGVRVGVRGLTFNKESEADVPRTELQVKGLCC